jgi:hypothetical protein
MTALASPFKFVLIPADASENMIEIVKSSEGGLEKDEAQIFAKSHLAIEMVNIISLSLPTPKDGYIGVSMYSDGDGQDKGLPVNARASHLAQACGHKALVIHGTIKSTVLKSTLSDSIVHSFVYRYIQEMCLFADITITRRRCGPDVTSSCLRWPTPAPGYRLPLG